MEYTHFVSVAGLVRNSRGQILLVNSPGGDGNIQGEWWNLERACRMRSTGRSWRNLV